MKFLGYAFFVLIFVLICLLAFLLRVPPVVYDGGGDQIASNHPKYYYDQDIFVIGHVAGTKGVCQHLVEECKKLFPDMIIEGVEGVDYTKSQMEKFLQHSKGRPILFVGRLGRWVDIPGVKLFLDIPVAQIIEQRSSKEANATANDVLDWLKDNDEDYSTYGNNGYVFSNENVCLYKIETIYANLQYRIAHPQQNIIWVNGPSGSGKSTLMKGLRARKIKNLYICDVDDIIDNIYLTDSDNKQNEKIKEATMKVLSSHKNVVFIGLFINLYGLANYQFAIDLDPETNYIRLESREIDTVCDNKKKIMKILNDKKISLDDRSNKIVFGIKNRSPVVADPSNAMWDINRTRQVLSSFGFVFLPANEIVKIISHITY